MNTGPGIGLLIATLIGAAVQLGIVFALMYLPQRIDTWRAHFFSALGRFVEHEVPLTVGIERLADSVSWPYSHWLSRVAFSLAEGTPLDEAVRQGMGLLGVFGGANRADAALLCRAREGVPLATVLAQLEAKYRARVAFRQRMRTQIVMPLYLLFFVGAALTTMSGTDAFVVPAFQEILTDIGGEAAMADMQVLLARSRLVIPLLLGSVMLIALGYVLPRTRLLRTVVIRVPLLGRLVRYAEWALIGRHLQAAVLCERPLVEALDDLPAEGFTARTADEISGAVEAMRQGTAPDDAFGDLGLPSGWHALIALGLGSGGAGAATCIGRASDYLEDILMGGLERGERIFGATVVVVAGLLVGLLVSGLFGALLAMTELLV